MELARKELGEEALLIDTRPAAPETRGLGEFEVIFGLLAANPSATLCRPDTGSPQTSGASPCRACAGFESDLAEIKRQIAHLTECLDGWRAASGSLPGNRLPASQTPAVETELACLVARGETLTERFRVDATLGRGGACRAFVALAGPAGSGKTTTLAKLAVRYGLAARRPVRILSLGAQSIGGVSLPRIAALLGIECSLAETAAAFEQALVQHPSTDLLLIDTPELSPGETAESDGLARILATHLELDVHLVLPATMSPPDLQRMIERYEPLRPGKLLFTRVDEASSFGPLLHQSAQRDLPLSFLGTGQRIPDDLEAATEARLQDLGRAIISSGTRSTGATA